MIRSTCAKSPRKSGVSTSIAGGFFELAQTLDAGSTKPSRPTIIEIVTIDGCDDHVFETHLDDRLDQLPRLIGVEGGRSTMGDRAVGAVTGTDPAVDEEGRRAARKSTRNGWDTVPLRTPCAGRPIACAS